ncbi:ABC transporter substrate-binding protein [Aureimonas fodinaquatilis]|uniref:ABC transporter substrate-binding protein n=1 Tax=Aureimonas fodinaquatilis TaxID=2565783 RepID=A0A5B0DV13_9HYPH|nr:ABC transporter substrate-binding protein [Aureimonas fodinaquatilis]KAA0969039.1 ABC transporter substrate-binding protein [Aureimonas fodinaquatilis]
MNKRRFLTTVAATVFAATLLPASVQAQDKTDINFRLDWSIYGSHAPFYLALQKGMYSDAGLNVTIGEGQGSATVAQLIAQGQDQLGFVDFGTMARGVEQGMPVTAVMRVISDVMCIISHADAPITEPKGLEGKVVAFAPSESTALVFPALLASQEVDPASVSVLNPAFGAKNAMFLQKRADAIPGNYNVQVAQLEGQGAEVEYFRFADFGLRQMNNGIIVNNSFKDANPEALKAFLEVTAAAFEQATADPEVAVDALIEVLPEQRRNRDVLLRQLVLTADSYKTENTQDKPFGWMEAKDWEDTQHILTEYGGMPRSLPVEQFYTNDFLPES